MPVRAVATGFRATATLTGASITAATAVSATLAKTGVGTGMKVAIIPLRAGAKALSGELSRETLGRNCWRGERRAWIEMRGLRSGGDDELGRVVLNAIQAHPGVGSASLNYPLSRVVVAIDDPDTSLRELCRIVDDAEKAERHRHPDQAADQLAQSPGSLPGDGVLLAVRAVTVAATAAGLGLALGGRALRWPRFPLVIEAAVAAVDHQPLLRRLLEDRIGTEATATVLELAMAAAHTVTLSPAALSVDLTIQALKAAECRAGARAWRRHEPQLALHADEPADQPQSLWPRPARSTQPVQRSVARFALIQALSAVLVGAGTRDADMAATATLVATPKASRTTPEAFAAALGQGLADQHAVLPLRPESLRRLDRVDAIVIDPRVLCTDDLRVARIRGCGADELSTAWNRAQLVLTESGLRPGWHRVPGVSASGSDSAVEALFRPMHDRLASAVVAEAHRTGADLVSVDVDALGELRPVFDDIRPLDDGASGSLDEALARAVAELRQAGRTVAVLSSVGKQALSAADVALGVLPPPGAGAPPWYADVLLPDLGAAWRVLHAIPAARAARLGAPEVVLAACEGIGSSMDDAVAELAANGLRVIAVAHRQLTAQQAQSVVDDPDEIARLCRDELSLVGFLGLSDTPRAQAAALLADLHEHDLDIRLITGDHPITAAAIAEELGMQVSPEQVISGAEWDALSRKDQERAVAERVIFARMTPENKVQIVQTLEHSGRVCAMVGDGSNDAAAIRAATVGIGVVAHGSDPARVAADLVLVDGRIESLLPAILEGRQLWQRVQAAVSVLLGGNAGEVAFAIIGSAITGTSPLNTRQLLLVNMLTDALPAAALAVSKPSDPVTPATRGPDQRELWRAVGIRGATTAAAATVAWVMAGFTGLPRRASTVALVALVAAQLGQTLVDSHAWLVVLTALGSLAALATLISIPVVSQLLGCTPLDPLGWAQATAAATAATVAVAVLNRVLTGRDKSGQPNPQPPETDALSRDASPGAPPGPRRRRRATARRKAPVKAPSATRQTTKPKGPPAHRSSSTYPRR